MVEIRRYFHNFGFKNSIIKKNRDNFSNSLACYKICKENEGDIILLLLNFFYLHSICTGQKISKGIFSLLTKINAKIDYTLGLILQTIFWTIFCPFLEEVTI